MLLGVAPPKTVFEPFASYITFLFIGSFILAQRCSRIGSIGRFALDPRASVGRRKTESHPVRLRGGDGLHVGVDFQHRDDGRDVRHRHEHSGGLLSRRRARTARRSTRATPTGLMLMTSFAASVGGLATPIGTPPNMIGLEKLRALGVDFSFFQWSMLGFPLVGVLFLFMFGCMNFFCRARRARDSRRGRISP